MRCIAADSHGARTPRGVYIGALPVPARCSLPMRLRFLLVAILSACALVACRGDDTATSTSSGAAAGVPSGGPSAKSSVAAGARAAAETGIAPAVPGDPMGVVARKLKNGLTLMLSENHEEPRIE